MRGQEHLQVDLRGSSILGTLKILVIEDDDDARALTTYLLENMGAQVREAHDAVEGFAAAQDFPADIIVSDIGMPGEDGISLMRRIRALDGAATAQVPALAVSAFTGVGELAAARAAGFDAFLAKPVDPVVLVAKVAQLAGWHSALDSEQRLGR